ncbi:DUF2927 domain-containing protein [Ancylothrix sp. C2]|uniref:DUF2927 domain-containing protein n=1 Tax=Ancylothrix sp. D3o TaxID=2953691 RepID=UPI0021BB0684|nr:DUF2927 domain-containing protein [Ancylothrix sp. D3o]MCT7953097.1 DUF2927 domain-containing protein [Ancylothrix sp. D3o]
MKLISTMALVVLISVWYNEPSTTFFGQNNQPKTSTISPDETFLYFKEVTLKSEFGSSDDGVIKKWMVPIKLEIAGLPTPQDLQTVETVTSELKLLTNLPIEFVKPNTGNIRIRFTPEAEFQKFIPTYQPGNSGFFWLNWDETKQITGAEILISTTGVTQKERSHLIREELTQAFGLPADSDKYPDSIFYQQWTDITEYSSLDKKLIKMLYSPQVKPGMNESQLEKLWRENRL